ncbi:GNAT family N-acetyltransferase [Shouchella clausii]|uniref:GNAT family N-acetyltransferase n=1 Tax=Shouchella clausii TaxID=79880 RepID=UPI00280BE86B|nr:GNAT family N-acetyltransferase [Shouchella clausii]WMM31959.1 GNAT family N-acetyltransferase [Shouchella clausii]
MKTRKAEKQDIVLIQEIAKRSWEDTYKDLIPADIRQVYIEQAYSRQSLSVKINSSAAFFVAEEAGKVIGFAQLTRSENETDLAALYVDPKMLGFGAGTLLFETVVRELKQGEPLVVYLEKGNFRAERFYTKCGFAYKNEFKERLFGHVFHTVKMVFKRDGERNTYV